MPEQPMPFTKICEDYLARGKPFRTMSNTEIAVLLESHEIAPHRFNELLRLNDMIGGRRIPVAQTINGRTRTIQHSIGVPPDASLSDSSDPSVEYFAFGVAAPCTVEVSELGTVIAQCGSGPEEVAESFPMFLEGQAHEVFAESLGWPVSTATYTDRTATTLRAELPTESLVTEATDHRSAWWHTNDYVADLTTFWMGSTDVRLRVWSKSGAPPSFERFL